MTDHNELLNEKENKFKEEILKLEKESIDSITKTDDREMVRRIISLYEEEQK